MNVKELIEKLQQLPQDVDVCVQHQMDDEFDTSEIEGVTLKKVRFHEGHGGNPECSAIQECAVLTIEF